MNKKSMEMTISTIVILVMALILLAVGIYMIYTKILKPSETTTSFITCEARGGILGNGPGCPGQDCLICPQLVSETTKQMGPCCIKTLT